jgi:hypothetical protein
MTRKLPAAADTPVQLYTLDVFIVIGPITESFAEKNPVISRTIQIRGDQTLEDLHHAIFDAFDREDEHLYEFQVGGKGPMDPKARHYGLSVGMIGFDSGMELSGSVATTTIGALGLKAGQPFGYWFDFGDDWRHQIDVLAIEDKVGRGRYPKVTRRTGKSPPQYADWDEEDEG